MTASLGRPGFLNNEILYPVRPRHLATNLTFGKDWRHHCPHCAHRPNATSYIATAQSLPERLELPFSSDAILSGYEDIVFSGSDHFTAWVNVSPHEVLVQHMVDIHNVMADFREASERKLLHFLKHIVSRNILLPDQLCRRDSASSSGTLGPDVGGKTHLRNKLRGSGILLPCKKRLTI